LLKRSWEVARSKKSYRAFDGVTGPLKSTKHRLMSH
jgi:hypothetical protein